MKKTFTIGWQKYEDVLESQINSPVIDQLYQSMIKRSNEYTSLQGLSEEELEQLEEILSAQLENPPQEETMMLNIDENLAGEISLATNFDCCSRFLSTTLSTFLANSSIFSGGHSGTDIPNPSSICNKSSLISFRDFLPKFGVLSISDSVFCTKSPI